MSVCYNPTMELLTIDNRIGYRRLTFLLVLSLGLHFFLFFLMERYARFSSAPAPPSETFVRLVDPSVLPSPPSVLFGTKNLKDLEKLPRGEETKLPPIPHSSQPGMEPSSGRSEIPEPTIVSPSPSVKTAPPPSLSPPPSLPNEVQIAKIPGLPTIPTDIPDRPPETPPPLQDSSAPNPPISTPQPSPLETLPSLQDLSVLGPQRPSSTRPGLPGLPFVKPKDLERLAKLFTDQNTATKAPNDRISVNTRDLKYYSYGLQVLNKIEAIWRYPKAAGQTGIGGEVVVDMMIRRDGTLDDLVLIQSSGYGILDDEVRRAVRRAAPYSSLPAGLIENPFPMSIHFIYIANSHFVYRSR